MTGNNNIELEINNLRAIVSDARDHGVDPSILLAIEGLANLFLDHTHRLELANHSPHTTHLK